MNALVLHRRQHLAITFPGDDGAQDLLARRLADHVGDDVGQLDVLICVSAFCMCCT